MHSLKTLKLKTFVDPNEVSNTTHDVDNVLIKQIELEKPPLSVQKIVFGASVIIN
jgi:hypothetical protein